MLGLFGYFSPVVRSPLFWPWEESNYPSRSCNGPNGLKGPKLKQNKQKQTNETDPSFNHLRVPSAIPDALAIPVVWSECPVKALIKQERGKCLL